MKSRLAFLFTLVSIVLLAALLGMPGTGCTSAQVDQAVDAGNRVVAATKQPVVDDLGALPGVGPYVRLGAQIIADAAYEIVRVLNLFAPRAGEPPATQPSSQLEDRAAPAPLPVRAVVARR